MPSVAALAIALGLGAGLDVEVAGGELPVSAARESEASATLTTVPQLRLGDPNRDPLVLSYLPRIFFRYPDSLALGRPTLLHQGRADWSQRITPDFQLGAQVSGSYGEADYTATQAVFGDAQLISPEETVLNVARVDGALTETLVLDRRTTLRLSLPSGYLVSGRVSGGAERRTWNTGANPGITYLLTRRDTATLDLAVMVFDSGPPRFLQSSATVGWAHLLTARLTSDLGTGVSRVDALRGPTEGATMLFGLGHAGLTHQRETGAEGIRLSLDARLDPVLGEVRPQIGLDANGSQSLSPTVVLNAGLRFGTTANREPLGDGRTETRYGANLVASWQVDPAIRLRGGFRAEWLAPHWVEGIGPERQTLLGFVGVSMFYPVY